MRLLKIEASLASKLVDALTTGRDASGTKYLEVEAKKNHAGPNGVEALVFRVRYAMKKEDDSRVRLVCLEFEAPTRSYGVLNKFIQSTVKAKIEQLARKVVRTSRVNLSAYSHKVQFNQGMVAVQ